MKFIIDNGKKNIIKIIKIVVHGGSFHADDVIAIALAVVRFGNIEVDRVFSVNEDTVANANYIIDVGENYDGIKFFDHHQVIELYEDGVHPCGATLFAKKIFPAEIYSKLYERCLKAIAIQDNGQVELMKENPNLLFGWISQMNPIWNSGKSFDECFENAVNMAIPMIQQILGSIEAESEAEKIFSVREELADGKIIVLPEYAPWHEYACALEKALFVIHPSNRGGFVAQCVPPSVEEGFAQRMPLPQEWLTTKPEGCVFCHKNLFLASFNAKENAIKAISSLVE